MRSVVLSIALLTTLTAAAQSIERINPEGMTQPTAYTHLVKHGDLMFIAGQVAVDGDGNIVGEGDMAAQLRQVLENLNYILASEGADFSHIVKVQIFTTDVDALREAYGAIRGEYFGDQAPASTLVGIERLARTVFLVEIEAIAIAPG